jgi:carotenoid cleavage dioxygenase-like enzyme
MSQPLQVVDPATIAELSGRFEPVSAEIDAAELPVQGELPRDLVGAYFRNGPNPRFTPLGSYTYPLEGDAMVHGLWLDEGRARYANRWVRTRGMAAEERAGRALYGGMLTPAFVDADLIGAEPDPGWPFRLDPFINVVCHAGRYLALEEGTPPYEITPDLGTVGLYDFGGALTGMCAHPKVDPVTGEMVLFRYDVEQPYLAWAVVGPDGTVTRPLTPVPGVDQGFMVHDFAITEHYVVVVIGPGVLDMDAMLSGGAVLQWRPELGTRVVVIPRDGSNDVRWIDTEAFWVWHFANAYETDEAGELRIVVDFPWWSALGFVTGGSQPVHGSLVRATLDPVRRRIDLVHVDERGTEFPRIDDRLLGHPHRSLTVVGSSGRAELARGEHDLLIRYDMASGESQTFDCGAVIGEVAFAPRPGGSEELDGYYLAFASSLGADRSARFLVWDAADFPNPPVAEVAIPHRVPNGLHGNWFPANRAEV